MSSRSPSSVVNLGRMEDAQPEQVEAGATVHVPLDQLESMDLPLHNPVAPGQLQCRGDGIPIPPEPASEGCIGGMFRSFKPTRPRCGVPLTDKFRTDRVPYWRAQQSLEKPGRAPSGNAALGGWPSTTAMRSARVKREAIFLRSTFRRIPGRPEALPKPASNR